MLKRTLDDPAHRGHWPLTVRGPESRLRPTGVISFFACCAAILVGFAAGQLLAATVAVITLLPFLSHARWVGVRRALAEPSVVTIILMFYVFVFPLRGLAMAASRFTDVQIAHGTVSGADLASLLIVASLGTTALVEAFHRRARAIRPSSTRPVADRNTDPLRTGLLAAVLGGLTIASLGLVILQNHGLTGAESTFVDHTKTSLATAKSSALTIWEVLSVPTVWCATCAALDTTAGKLGRLLFVATGSVIILAHLLIFGSRLNALLALAGVWVVLYYSGRPIRVAVILGAIAIAILVSVPIVSQRKGGDLSGLSTVEQYSRITGYGVLDASLAVAQQPTDIKGKLSDSHRWLDAPLYLIPSPIWPGKPTLESKTMDLYVAQSLGNSQQQDTGFPASYTTELRLYGGVLGVLLVSILLGDLLGRLHRSCVGTGNRIPPSSLIWYCFVVTSGFSYFKDGDILTSLIGDMRNGFYLGVAMIATGVWNPFAFRGDDIARAPEPGVAVRNRLAG